MVTSLNTRSSEPATPPVLQTFALRNSHLRLRLEYFFVGISSIWSLDTFMPINREPRGSSQVSVEGLKYSTAYSYGYPLSGVITLAAL